MPGRRHRAVKGIGARLLDELAASEAAVDAAAGGGSSSSGGGDNGDEDDQSTQQSSVGQHLHHHDDHHEQLMENVAHHHHRDEARRGSARRGLPTQRIERLEAQARSIRKAQLRRRQARREHEMRGFEADTGSAGTARRRRRARLAANQQTEAGGPRVAQAAKQWGLDSGQLPTKLDDDEGYVERRFPRAAKQRRALAETAAQIRRLQGEVTTLRKRINLVNADVHKAEKRRDTLQDELSRIVVEDDIEEQRRNRGLLIEVQKARLQECEEKIRDRSRYTRTLERMLKRLQRGAVVFQGTIKAYQEVLKAQREEVEEVEEEARAESHSRMMAQRRLAALRQDLADQEDAFEAQLLELRQVARARENLSEQYNKMRDEQKQRADSDRVRQTSVKLLTRWKQTSKRKKMDAVEAELDGLMEKFRKIELVTGLRTEFDIVQRYFHQDDYCKEMEQKTVFLRGQIARANARLRKLRSLHDKDKFYGDSAQSSKHAQQEVERISDELTALRVEHHHAVEEKVKYAGYVLEASQSLRHMTSVVESADPAFAAANADRARAHAASLALAEADESLTATNGSIGSTGGNFVRKASEAAITVSTDARMHATPEDVERLASDLQANMDVILSTLFPSNNVGEVGSLVAPRSVHATPAFDKNAVTAEDQANMQSLIMHTVIRNSNNVRIPVDESAPLSVQEMLNTRGRDELEQVSTVSQQPDRRQEQGGTPSNNADFHAEGSDQSSSQMSQEQQRHYEAMLKRQAIKTGMPVEELREIYSGIPRAHRTEVLDRRTLKETSIQCRRKALKTELKWHHDDSEAGGHAPHKRRVRRQQPSVDDSPLPEVGGNDARSSTWGTGHSRSSSRSSTASGATHSRRSSRGGSHRRSNSRSSIAAHSRAGSLLNPDGTSSTMLPEML